MKSRTNSNQLINKNDIELEKTHIFKDLCNMKCIFFRILFPLYGIVWTIAAVVILYY